MVRNFIIPTGSALIVLGQLTGANAAPIFAQVAPFPTLYVEGSDYTVFANTGLGDNTASVTSVSGFGCSAANYAGFPAGTIALVAEGSCTSEIKVGNAIAAGAAAVLIYDDAVGPLPYVSLANPVTEQVLFITNSVGLSLVNTLGETAKITVTELVPPTAVPVPATIWLLVSGFIALPLLRRRERT